MIPPPLAVRRAFGAGGQPELLSATSGGVWRVGDVVLKLVGDPVEAEFIAAVSAQLPSIASPVRADDAGWTHDGWAATRWVDAQPDPARWDEVLHAGDELHAALAALDRPWPPALDARTSPWAIADRVAWGEGALPDLAGIAERVSRRALAAATGGLEPRQVIHGDLAGNVLFPIHGPPVVIDLSPYRRPVSYATAVTVLDQVCWHGAPAERTGVVAPTQLARAIVFRVVAAALQSPAAGAAEAVRAAPLLE